MRLNHMPARMLAQLQAPAGRTAAPDITVQIAVFAPPIGKGAAAIDRAPARKPVEHVALAHALPDRPAGQRKGRVGTPMGLAQIHRGRKGSGGGVIVVAWGMPRRPPGRCPLLPRIRWFSPAAVGLRRKFPSALQAVPALRETR